MKTLILWGATGQALVLAEFMPEQGYKIAAIFDREAKTSLVGAPVYLVGAPVYPPDRFSDWLEEQVNVWGLIAIGGNGGQDRNEIHARFKCSNVLMPLAVHPTAYIAQNAHVCDGAQMLAGAIVGAHARVGYAAIVNTNASVDHECEIGDYAHIGPGATLAGCVKVGAQAFIGAGAVVAPHLTIGPRAVVGAGAVVVEDVPADAIVLGNPAHKR